MDAGPHRGRFGMRYKGYSESVEALGDDGPTLQTALCHALFAEQPLFNCGFAVGRGVINPAPPVQAFAGVCPHIYIALNPLKLISTSFQGTCKTIGMKKKIEPRAVTLS